MPSKKKKYNARFPAGRIKKIMQSDEEIGKVAQAVPVIISRTLELFVESLLNKTLKITTSRNAKTLSTSHMKQCIMAEQRFDFLRELVKNIPDISIADETAGAYLDDEMQSSPEPQYYPDSDTPYDLSMPSTSARLATNGNNQRSQQFPLRSTQNGGTKLSTSSSISSIQIEATNVNEGNNLRIKKTNLPRPLRDPPASVSKDCVSQKYGKEFQTNIIREVSSLRTDTTSMPSVIRNTQNYQEIGKVTYDINSKGSSISAKTAATFAEGENLTYKRTKEQANQRKAIFQNITSNNSSVIKHTNASQDSYPPQKLPRTDSAPVVDRTTIWHPTEHRYQTSSHSELVTHHNKEQSSESHTSNDTISYPPIPAPIVSIDFCNKPVVKIDYSNLSIPPVKQSGPSIIEPLHRTPTTVNSFNPANNEINANLNSEPVINIDLSNIVTNTSGDINNKPKFSLDNITSMSSYMNSSLAAQMSLSNNSKAPVNFSRTNSNFMPSSSSSVSDLRIPLSVTKSSPSTAAINNKKSFFELDEDYDNI